MARLGQDPLISVIIPLYNHEKYIRESIFSILGQTVQDFEIIVIDDGSTDGSGRVVRDLEDPRIIYTLQENSGAHAAINRGIRSARGEYVCILNSDDMYHPGRFEECLRVLESDRSLAAVFTHVETVDAEGKLLGSFNGAGDYCWKEHSPETSFKGEGNVLLDLLGGNFLITTSNLFCRRSVFGELGGFAGLRYAHDYDFFLRLCCSFKVAVIEKNLLSYRMHELNTVRENESAVNFEVGLVLARFLSSHELRRVFEEKNGTYGAMVKFMNSLNTRQMEKMVLTLLVFCGEKGSEADFFFRVLSEDLHNPFREACIAKAQQNIELWQDSQRVWKQAQETGRLLGEAEERARTWWLNAQEGWKQAEEARRRSAELEEKLAYSQEEAKKYCMAAQASEEKASGLNEELEAAHGREMEKDRHIALLLQSRSFRLGRALTWPVRKLVGKDSKMFK